MQSERVVITLDLDLAWIGEGPTLQVSYPCVHDDELIAKVRKGYFECRLCGRRTWREMQEQPRGSHE